MQKQSLLIIGAGASGLMAAKKLSKKFNVTVLEAQTRIGGRIHSKEIAGDLVEAGAEFIHGKLPVTFDLLKEAKLEAVPVAGKMYRHENGKFIVEDEMLDNWDDLLKKMKSAPEDATMHQFLEQNYPGPEYESFREKVNAYTKGFDIADPAKASVQSLSIEWHAEEENNFRVVDGYTSIIRYLAEAAGCVILTETTVKQVIWQTGRVIAITDTGATFEADKIIVSVPLGILQNPGAACGISFEPAINDYLDAALNIGYGNVIKVLIKFKEAFWQKDAGFILSSEKLFPTWWTHADKETNILTGWCGGPESFSLSRESDENILSLALHSLASIFNIAVPELEVKILHSEINACSRSEFMLGAYSYDTIYSTLAKSVLNKPISDTIFFAGEALYSGKHPGTVEAALESGLQVARAVSKTIA